jgi:Flp pilus assembly protein TadG
MGVTPDAGRMKRRGERGQALVEFALIAPLFAIILLGCFQMGVAFTNYIAVTDAARAGARAAAVAGSAYTKTEATAVAIAAASDATDQNPSDNCTTGKSCTTLDTDPTGINGWAAGNGVIVTVTAPYSIDLLGFTVASGLLKHKVTMRIQSTTTGPPS